MRSILDYFYANTSHCSYGVVGDPDRFFHTTYLALALRHEALLHAVVAYAAYQRAMLEPHGQLQDFLGYYTRAVTLLLGSLKKQQDGSGHDLGTLLTILQLATVEEYFGDMMHLMGHQKAAKQILTQLFTPQTIVATPMGRLLFSWYSRIDLLLAPMWGLEPALPREWHEALETYVQMQLSSYCSSSSSSDNNNHNNNMHNNSAWLQWLIELADVQLRIVFRDMAALTARRKTGAVADDEFQVLHRKLTLRLREWRDTLPPALTDPSYLLQLPPGTSNSKQQLFHHYETTEVPLYEGPLVATTTLVAHWHVVVLMHLSQVTAESMMAETAALLGGLAANSEAVCQIVEAADSWVDAPAGLHKRLCSMLVTVAMFMPRRKAEQAWLRRKLAWLEAQG